VKDWSDKPVVIIASGPSLCDEDINLVKPYCKLEQIRVIVINDNWQLIPYADVLYAADHSWWTSYHHKVARHFTGELWTCDSRIAGHYAGVQLIDSRVGSGLPEQRDFIKVGSTSTTQAIQLAYLWGAKHVALLGVDCQPTGGRKHWFGNHPPCLDERLPFDRWIEELSILAKELAAEEVSVTNCSRETALTCFPRTTLEDFLKLHMSTASMDLGITSSSGPS
jgi:hypothetical protein